MATADFKDGEHVWRAQLATGVSVGGAAYGERAAESEAGVWFYADDGEMRFFPLPIERHPADLAGAPLCEWLAKAREGRPARPPSEHTEEPPSPEGQANGESGGRPQSAL